MPTFDTSLFEIRVRQEFLEQELINLYYYTPADEGGQIPAADICQAFNDTVQRDVEAVQQDAVVGVDIRCRRFGSISETIVDISTQFGVRPGPPSPSFVAWGFILNRESIDMRNGAKRYGGVSEDDTADNGPDVGVLTVLGELANSLSLTLDVAGGREIKPVIYRRDSFIDDEWFGSNVQGAQFTSLTSQVSRKQALA